MKNLILTILIAVAFNSKAKTDTITNWQVEYNKIEFAKFNEFSKDKILRINLGKIKPQDSLTIKYFRDTPCPVCNTEIYLVDEKGNHIVKGTGKNTFEPVTISLLEIKQFIIDNKGLKPQVFFLEIDTEGKETDRQMLFEIETS